MNPVLFKLYGPLAIHMYGLCIALGAIISFYLFNKDPKIKTYFSQHTLITVLQLIIIGAYVGGRVVCILTDYKSVDAWWLLVKFWEPGFSILGSMIGIALVLPLYLHLHKIPLLAFLDRASIYAPLVQTFGRLGCFFTGCCYGKPTQAWYGIVYTHQNHVAPLHCSLHPTQLYSSLMLFCIFLFLYFIQQHRTRKTGVIFLSYIILMATERFLIDFVRWDRIFVYEPTFLQLFSIHQWIALGICTLATIGAIVLSKSKA